MIDVLQDLSIITNIGKYNFDKLINRTILIIGHAVEEAKRDNKDSIVLSIGIGELHILNINSDIKYNFIPDKHLVKIINNVKEGKADPLASAIDEEITVRLKSVYKELM